MKAVVLSPHSDDAAISLGSILFNNFESAAILVPFNRSLENILGIPGEVTDLRKEEDNRINERYGFVFSYGNFPDTSLRGVTWNAQKNTIDQELLAQVTSWLYAALPKDGVIFLPHAFGMHPDHRLSRHAIQQALQGRPAIEYVEQPYYFPKNPQKNGILQIPFDQDFKEQMLSAYVSQLSPERIRLLSKRISCEYLFLGRNT